MEREPRKTRTEKVDLTVPLNVFEVTKVKEDNCFGQLWDPSTTECKSCADSEVCGIMRERALKKQVKKIEEEKGPFLDTAIMHRVTDEQISKYISSIPVDLPVKDLVDEVLRMAGSKDVPSAVERIKRYKAKGFIKIKNGIVQWQEK